MALNPLILFRPRHHSTEPARLAETLPSLKHRPSLESFKGVISLKFLHIGRTLMRTVLSAVACLVILGASGASAQQAGDNLNETQRHGRQLLAQSCGVCHLSPSLNART